MKIIDEKGRLFKKINIVDLAVLLAIILVVAGVVYSLFGQREEPLALHTQFLITVHCPEVPQAAVDKLYPGDQIVYGNVFVNGHIVSSTGNPSKIDEDKKGSTYPDLYDAIVEIRIDNDPNDPLIMIGPYQVNIGKEFVVKTDRVEIRGIIQDIVEYEE